MRLTLVAVSILASASQVAFGQSGPYLATVTDSAATLRAGPGNVFDTTYGLRVGDSLLVDHEEQNGWLAVQDAPGKMYSLSWVPMQFVNFDKNKPIPQNVVVEEEVTLAPGQIGSSQPMPNFRRTKIPAGSILTIIGPKATFENKSWYPVLPPSGDFRYIAKQQVKYDKPVNTSFTIRTGPDLQLPSIAPQTSITPAGSTIPPQPVAVIPAIGGPLTLPPAGTNSSSGSAAQAAPVIQHPLWVQAEAAEKDGRTSEAVKLYYQLAQQVNQQGGDYDIANMCYTRIHSIREKQKTTLAGTTTSTPRAVLTDPAQPGKTSVTTVAVGGNQRPDYVGTGRLTTSTAMRVDGYKTYVLDNPPGSPISYVIAGPGVDLDRYIGKQINLYGTKTDRKDVPKPLVSATAAELAQ